MRRSPLAALALAAALIPSGVLAWGGFGHRMIGVAAMQALPADLPGFLKTPQAIVDVGEYSREPDRIKSAGRAFDADRDPAHFLDLDDDATVLGGPKITALPPTRRDYEAALQAAKTDSWKAGYLPYAILESYQQLAQDFAYWKALDFSAANPAWAAHKAFFVADRARRERQILITIGELSHYVGDGGQPLHLTIHFNGWGDYPNPKGYSTAKLHAPFEGDLVRQTVTLEAVVKAMSPPRPLVGSVEARISGYLGQTAGQVIPFYEMEKAGGLKLGDRRGSAFATRQIAGAASELRDMISMAWQASDKQSVGWRPLPLADILAGKLDPYPALYAID